MKMSHILLFRNIIWGRRIQKSYGVRWIFHASHRTISMKIGRSSRFLIAYLSFCAYPRVNHFFISQIKACKKPKSEIHRTKGRVIISAKLKEHVSDNGYAGYKKSAVPQPHVNGRVTVKAFSAHSNFIKPTLGSYIRFFDTLKFEIPPINQNTGGQMHENCFKQIAKISNRKTHQKTQNHALIAVEKRATCRKILSHWFSYSGHNVHYFILYFTTYDPKKLHFFKYLQELTILSFSIQRRCA